MHRAAAFLRAVDRLLGALMRAGRWLAPLLALLLFAQWPLRDWVQAYSREANDLAQIGFAFYVSLAVTAATTMVHALTTRSVDIVLAALLLVGGVIGAQYGAMLATRVKPDLLRLALAIIILLVALRMALGLAWRPDEVYSIEYL